MDISKIQFFVSSVEYNQRIRHISAIFIRKNQKTENGYLVSEKEIRMPRSIAVSKIEDGVGFATITRNQDGTWEPGQRLTIETVNGGHYLRTHLDGKLTDNLDNLPEIGNLTLPTTLYRKTK